MTSDRASDPLHTDFLIVGSGIAGLRAAMALAPIGRVLILTKAEAAESNTGYAQGGIAAALGEDDSVALHAADTIRAGDGLCDEGAVQILVSEGPKYVRELMAWGAQFDLGDGGQPALGLEAAHSARRILHAGDSTGREIGMALWRQVVRQGAVSTVNHALVTDLVVRDGLVVGAAFFDEGGKRREVRAGATLLATGGAGQVFRETTNPAVATGDGIALAYQAGARVADLEFVQFHPTALKVTGAPRFLISEALRGEGARLVNADGDAFMDRYHADGDLAPRDIVARSIVREGERTGREISLSLAHLEARRVRARFPTIAEMCRQLGIDIATDRIPVGPAAHYLMGGIDTDEWGRTSLPGLYAAGETACTGVHGANRLASNSLLEGLVFGARAARAMTEPPRAAALKADRRPASRVPSRAAVTAEGTSDRAADDVSPGERAAAVDLDVAAIRDLMWRAAGLFRSRDELARAVRQLETACAAATADASSAAPVERRSHPALSAEWWRRYNLLTVAWLVARAALRREESRGGHFRADFPLRDDLHWKVHLVDTRDQHGQ